MEVDDVFILLLASFILLFLSGSCQLAPAHYWILCLPFWQFYFIKLFDASVQCEFIWTFFLLLILIRKQHLIFVIEFSKFFGILSNFIVFSIFTTSSGHFYLLRFSICLLIELLKDALCTKLCRSFQMQHKKDFLAHLPGLFLFPNPWKGWKSYIL